MLCPLKQNKRILKGLMKNESGDEYEAVDIVFSECGKEKCEWWSYARKPNSTFINGCAIKMIAEK